MVDHVRRLRDLVGADELLQLPSVSIALRDASTRVLLVRHAEGNTWLLPGGCIEPGETPADAAAREMWEETGLLVRLTRIVGVFGGSAFIVRYRNGHRTSYVTTVFEARPDRGTLGPDGAETLELSFFSHDEARRLSLATWVPEVMEAVFADRAEAAFRRPAWTAPGPGTA